MTQRLAFLTLSREDWQTWHEMPPPRDFVGNKNFGQKWLQWAVARFELFFRGPQPAAYENMSDWCAPFDRFWLGEGSERTQQLARIVLDAYNDTHEWKCPRPRSVPDLARALDSGNRRGLAALIINAAGF